jgi:hypothetical protein
MSPPPYRLANMGRFTGVLRGINFLGSTDSAVIVFFVDYEFVGTGMADEAVAELIIFGIKDEVS